MKDWNNNFVTLLIVSVVALVAIVSMIFVPSITRDVVNAVDSSGFAFHPLYTGYALPYAYSASSVNTILQFSSATNNISRSFDVTDSIVYRKGFVSYDGQQWTPFILTTTNTLSGDWIYTKGTATISFIPAQLRMSLSRNVTNNTFVVIYSCSRINNVWDCHDGWQIIKFDAKITTSTPTPILICAANVKECVSSNVFRQCNSAGSAWTNTNCPQGQTCNGAGICSTPTPVQTCTANVKECYSSSVFRQCNSAGSAWTNTNCPQGQTCTGAGNCVVFTGTIYYIDATSGSDSSGTGSSAKPWKTLATACSKVKTSGDIIHVNKGTYTESSTCNLAVGVSIEGDSKTNTIISSSVGSNSYAITLSSGSSNTKGNQHISNLRIKSSTDYATLGAINVEYRGNVEINSIEIINFKEFGIVMHNGESSTSFATGNSIHDCTIINSGAYVGVYNSGDARGSIDITSQDGLKIYNNVITVDRPNGDNGNTIDGVEGFIKNVKIYNNVLYKKHLPGKTWDFSIEIWNWLGGNEIYNNNITGSIDVVLSSKGSSTYSVWIHDNRIGQPSLVAAQSVRGVLFEYQAADAIVERNYFYNVAAGIYLQQSNGARPVSNIRINYNIFDNIGANVGSTGWGILFSVEDYNDPVTNFSVYNNVFISATTGSTMYGIGLPDIGKATNINVQNNIVYGFDYAPVFASGAGGTSISGLTMTNNIFYGNGYSNNPRFNSITPQGTIKNNYIIDPKLSSTFHPNPGSPAINNGTYVGLTMDNERKTVSNPPEIGAYEYS